MLRRQTFAAIRVLLILTVVLGLGYPLAITGVAQLAMPGPANGSLVDGPDGIPVGSRLLGQGFEGPGWFHGRPDADDPTASGPSNLGPTNPELGRAVRERLVTVETADASDGPVPVDAVTGSGSGLDPDISPAYARLQAARVSTARGLPLADVLVLIDRSVHGRTLGFLGEPHVNVLLLNLALERLASST